MKYTKMIVAGIFGLVLLSNQPAAAVKAAEVPPIQETEADGEENEPEFVQHLAPDYLDPDYVKRQYLQEHKPEDEPVPFSARSTAANKTRSPFTGLTYTHADSLRGREVVLGIDVSTWQEEIDWAKVKKAGVKFAFIRCGYTSLSSKFAMYKDAYFDRNIQNAYKNGIQVGIYYFSNSITATEAQKEAQKTVELIKDYKNKISLPVVYDFEAFSNSYRAYGLSKAQVTKNTLTFFNIIEKAGFTPMYYGSPSFLNSSFDTNQLKDYDLWLANYTTKTSYTGDYLYWQYSSSGIVDGITTGTVDCNFYYSKEGGLPEPVEPPTLDLGPVTGLKASSDIETPSAIQIQWKPIADAHGYKIYRSTSYGGTYKKIKTVTGAESSEYTDTKVGTSEGKELYYKIVPYRKENSVVEFGEESKILTASTKRIHTFRLMTNAQVNLREQAGTEYKTLTQVPKGVGLTYKKFTSSVAGTKWYKVTYQKNGKSYTGYLSGSYVTRYTYGIPTKNVNLRGGPGLTYKRQRVVPKGIKLRIQKNTTDSTGTKWSQVRYTYKNKTYTGYIPTKYIERT